MASAALTMAGHRPKGHEMPDEETASGEIVKPIASPDTLKLFASMAAGIPGGDDEEAYEAILSQVLAAETWEDLDTPWESEGMRQFIGKRLRIESIKKRDSQYQTGLRIFLVVKGTDTEKGAKFTTTTSAVGVVAQLARAYFLGALPIICTPVEAATPTPDGYRPMHLKLHGAGGTKDKAPF